MKPSAPSIVETDIVLLGAGHANVQVLKAFGMHPPAGVRLTLVTDRLQAPYSGMLPGCLAGDYTSDDIHIDLARLTRSVGARLIHARATAIDASHRHILLLNRPPITYDLLAINVGITPDMSSIAGAAIHAYAVKPIAGLLERLARADETIRLFQRAANITVIGGGPAGIELALALKERGEQINQHGVHVTLVAGSGLVPSLNVAARTRLDRALAQAGITIIKNDRAIAVEAGTVLCQSGHQIPTDMPFVSTHAGLPQWLMQADFPKAGNGGLAIQETLQVKGHDRIFAAGDCATLEQNPRPRAGVFAVRQGPVLAKNLFAAAQNRRLQSWNPQKDYLSILRIGRGRAVAIRGRFFCLEGKWVWRWKDRIDRAFMAMFRVEDEAPDQDDITLRCGGCAAKVGPDPLARALARLPQPFATDDVPVGLNAPDDAAVINWTKEAPLITSVDQFRTMVTDPYLFGQIAANHALNDIYAMGGTPHHALALAILPHNKPSKTSEDLFQLLSGARATLDAAATPLVGGHSSEGEAVALGFSVTGRPGERILQKSGAHAGDHLILTKPLGTGIVFAADMRAMASSEAVEAILASMLVSNQQASRILVQAGATAMTDVSGFGLAGHLAEMLKQRQGETIQGADLEWSRLPIASGVLALADKGFVSSLLPENLILAKLLAEDNLSLSGISKVQTAILFDPQTAGGLLATVPAEAAANCVRALQAAGYRHTMDIGTISSQTGLRIR